MRRVILESPFRTSIDNDQTVHYEYLQTCIRNCLRRGESPYASHQMLTAALNDDVPAERTLGIKAGYEWYGAADMVVFYVDLGFSSGMHLARSMCIKGSVPFEERSLRGLIAFPPHWVLPK